MTKSIIVAVSENGCIGKDNQMPWHFPADFRWFKRLTWGHSMIMGRKTFCSIGKPLPGRLSFVLTHDLDKTLGSPADGVSYELSLRSALEMCEKVGESRVFFAGGASIYKQALPVADEIILTKIPGKYDGDTFFPEWPLGDSWNLQDSYRLSYYNNAESVDNLEFQIYNRKK